VFGRQLLIVEMGLRRVTLFDFTSSSSIIFRDSPIDTLLLLEGDERLVLSIYVTFCGKFSVRDVLSGDFQHDRASELGRTENLPLMSAWIY
jgi:hypothetical protein